MEWIKKMWGKKLELLGSRRFWQLTLVAILAILKLESGWSPELLTIIQGWLLAVTAIGTVDKWPKAFGK